MDDIDIWRTAKVLIDAHGDAALLEAGWRADKAVEDGKSEVAAVWKRITKAVAELTRTTSDGPVH